MRRLFIRVLFLFAAIIIATNPAAAAKKGLDQGYVSKNLQHVIDKFGEASVLTSRDSERALRGLGIPFAFVSITDSGFNVDTCRPMKGYDDPRVCDIRLSVTVREGQNKEEAALEVLRMLHYWVVAVGTNDAATIAALTPHASTIEPYNSDGENRGRFESSNEFTIVSFRFDR